jgi:hypothetical protein
MIYFFVNTNAQSTARGEHEVHTSGCGHAPDPRNQVHLGYYQNCRDALAAARARGYSPVDGCYYCLPGCHRT